MPKYLNIVKYCSNFQLFHKCKNCFTVHFVDSGFKRDSCIPTGVKSIYPLPSLPPHCFFLAIYLVKKPDLSIVSHILDFAYCVPCCGLISSSALVFPMNF